LIFCPLSELLSHRSGISECGSPGIVVYNAPGPIPIHRDCGTENVRRLRHSSRTTSRPIKDCVDCARPRHTETPARKFAAAAQAPQHKNACQKFGGSSVCRVGRSGSASAPCPPPLTRRAGCGGHFSSPTPPPCPPAPPQPRARPPPQGPPQGSPPWRKSVINKKKLY